MSDISQTGPHGPKSPSEDAPAMAEASTLSSPEIYEVIRRDGEEELARPSSSLFWSGLAAGALMSLSVLGESILHHHLPDTPSRVLVENFGYCLGFIVVILGRMQLFTENTITTVLPALAERSWRCLGCVARLWALVFGANLLGATLAAGFLQIPGVLTAGVLEAVRSVSQHAVALDPLTGFLRAIPSGIIIAALVWMIPRGQASSLFLIILFTWLIAVGDFTHVVAGSVEVAVLVIGGQLSFLDGLSGYIAPVLAGNIIGGTLIFTALAWGQVSQELKTA